MSDLKPLIEGPDTSGLDKQAKILEERRKEEKLRLAEKESELARKKFQLSSPKGRSLLIKTSPQGVQNLGGTNA